MFYICFYIPRPCAHCTYWLLFTVHWFLITTSGGLRTAEVYHQCPPFFWLIKTGEWLAIRTIIITGHHWSFCNCCLFCFPNWSLICTLTTAHWKSWSGVDGGAQWRASTHHTQGPYPDTQGYSQLQPFYIIGGTHRRPSVVFFSLPSWSKEPTSESYGEVLICKYTSTPSLIAGATEKLNSPNFLYSKGFA